MYDCDKDVCAYHKDEVTLPKTDQDSMRSRRDANRKRLRDGLSKANDPAPSEFVKQGSYAMKTMLRDAANDYDIDDGVYFWKEDLVGDRGAEKTSIQARWMVRDAIDDGSFKQRRKFGAIAFESSTRRATMSTSRYTVSLKTTMATWSMNWHRLADGSVRMRVT